MSKLAKFLLTLAIASLASNAWAVEVDFHGGWAVTSGGTATTTQSHLGSGAWQGNPATPYFEWYFYVDSQTFPSQSFQVEDIQSITYWTKDGPGAPYPTNVDFFLALYTKPGAHNHGWYGDRINAEPMYANSYSHVAGWNQWSTGPGTNELTWADHNHGPTGGYNGATWADIVSGPITWSDYFPSGSSTPINYATQDVMLIKIGTGSAWNGSFDGFVDEIVITLTPAAGGNTITFDLEGGAVHNITQTTDHLTIQQAVAAANSGDTIEIDPGTHFTFGSQAVINKSLTLRASNSLNKPLIKPTANTGNAGDARGWFLVPAGYTVNFEDLRFDGQGFLLDRCIFTYSSGLVARCVFENIGYNPSGPHYAGRGVAAFGDIAITVEDNVLSNIGRIGLYFYGAGTNPKICRRNTYTGKGDGNWLDYGVEVEGGAVVAVENNTITNCTGIASVDGSGSAALLATTYFATGTTANLVGNVMTDNSVGPYFGFSPTDVTNGDLFSNKMENNDYDIVSVSLNVIDASGNWWGQNTEPSGPIALGAVVRCAPIGPDGEAASGQGSPVLNYDGVVDYSPWLNSGTDTGGSVGFQGDFSVLNVSAASPQAGAGGHVQEAVNMVSGSTVYVMPGTYNENIIVNTPALTLDGAGSGSNPASNTIINGGGGAGITLNAAGTSALARTVIKDLRVTGCSNGINVAAANASYMTFNNVASVSNTGHGLHMNLPTGSPAAADLVVTGCSFSSNGSVGFRFPSYVGCNGLNITNSFFDGNQYGLYDERSAGTPILDNVVITGSSFNSNLFKGIYFESLDHATLTNIVVNNSGTGAISPSGVDINLKYGVYSSITFVNPTVTNSGTGSATGTGLTVKGRNDGSYASNPATLSSLLIDGGTFSGCPYNVSIGNNVTSTEIRNTSVSAGTAAGIAMWTDAGTSTNIHHNRLSGNAVNAGDITVGHTWNNNCYSDFTTNAGFPAQYNVDGGGGNIDYNPNTNGCTDVGFVLSDNLIGCSGTCDDFYLYLTLATANLPNLQVVVQLPAGITAALPPSGAVVTPPSNADASLINAYAAPVGTTVVVDMGFSGSGSTGDYTKYVARIPLVSTASTGTHAVTVISTLWVDQFNTPHTNALTVGAAAIEVDCTVPVINSFANTATCAFGSAAQTVGKFTLNLSDANSTMDSAWVTFVPGGGSFALFGANQTSPYTTPFPSADSAASFYSKLQEGCNTLTLHLTDSECNIATTVDILNVGSDNTAPSLSVATSIPANYCFNNDPSSANYGGAHLDNYIDITSSLGTNSCMAATGTLTISNGMNSWPLSLNQTNYPSTDGEALALWGWMLPIIGANNGASTTFDVNSADCAGNAALIQQFTICADTTKPQNAVTVFDARPAHLGVWLKWSWAAGPQAQEMRIYRSPLSGEYPGYANDLWNTLSNYDVTTVPPSGWTLVATQTALTGTVTSATYTNTNNRTGDVLTTHVSGSDTYWLDAENGWVNGHANASTFRDIYRYVTFVKDAGGNWSTGAPVVMTTNADRSTNYWLGDWVTADVAASTFNSSGILDTPDLNVLTPVYFGTGTFENIGPVNFENGTVGKSIPMPDNGNLVNFSDLVVFSFNYGVVSPVGITSTEFGFEPDPALAKPFTNLDEEPVVSLSLPTEATYDAGSEFTVTVSLNGNEGGVVKAVEAVLEYDDMLLEYVSSTTSNFTTEGTLFTKSALINDEPGNVGFVAAACGGQATLAEDAALGTVTFRVTREIQSACELSLISVEMLDNAGNIRSTESESISITSSSAIPDNYALYQNYPNPFNPTTNIQFDLVEAGHVTILVYNTLGQTVATVLDKQFEAGRHEVSFDASTLATGLYVYTIQANGFSDLKKMVLIR